MHRSELEDNETFFGERVAGRISPGHINRVAPALPTQTGERLGDACYRCAFGLETLTLIDAGGFASVDCSSLISLSSQGPSALLATRGE